ncbi:cAMP-binding domain of CRP or a regulatory subunit of cAMP-dependent protein kinases [Clostridium cavendishii DSM 21758]|uniref:cAMP-binding domain of CRP or a regulatory subunit of cAMP-dependent protein kinases n=1 Tax=Clostridium cavendishii DSM 21758 TaxID=1121302 RepID=A0A1M6GY56_9CLOT|nr:Crp/Fnr family transcriptional regulator [Clostridium cavendishii]SHJ14844.1 cAMP-binding domain of CRP or a regulatory subunit of cAMP-dependent protein kinases [Clostridium cavendishii DSM 21758]
MYQQFFNCERQEMMRDYFLNTLSKLGQVKEYKRNEIIDINYEKYLGIVVSGMVSQSIISLKGHEKFLYYIRSGEILNEMIHFCGGVDSIISKAKESVEISIISKEVLERELSLEPEIYRYFMHSMTRKFRIVMLQLTNSVFNDSRGQISDALLRLASMTEPNSEGVIILKYIYTHEELANNIGCSRITVTRCLNEFLKEGIIEYRNKKIAINKPDVLKSYVDLVIKE